MLKFECLTDKNKLVEVYLRMAALAKASSDCEVKQNEELTGFLQFSDKKNPQYYALIKTNFTEHETAPSLGSKLNYLHNHINHFNKNKVTFNFSNKVLVDYNLDDFFNDLRTMEMRLSEESEEKYNFLLNDNEFQSLIVDTCNSVQHQVNNPKVSSQPAARR